jgi:hypothetical protein
VLAGLAFRSIGPAIMGGRIDDFAVVESRPSTFYVATAAGGLWKTVNNGVTLEPVFDDQEVSSIGDVAVAPSDPSIVYVGTGEPNNRQSSSWGNGVYKSLDAGKTWIHLGSRTRTTSAASSCTPPTRTSLRRRPRPSLGTEQGARALPHDGRRQDLGQHEVRRRGHRVLGRGHGPGEPADPLRRVLPAPPHALRLQRRRARQRALEDQQRR